jgi:hypothetical protein
MNRGRGGRSLGERAADSGVQAAPAPPAVRRPSQETAYAPVHPGTGGSPAGGRGGEGRHCWVHDPPELPGTWPGLLVEWQQRGGSWHGRVAYTISGAHGPALVEAWLPASRLEPR